MRIDGLTPFEPTVAAPATAGAATSANDTALREAALQFEELLVRQLTQVLADTAKGDEEGGDSAMSFYTDQLPDVLASAIKDAGGLGLADQLVGAMEVDAS